LENRPNTIKIITKMAIMMMIHECERGMAEGGLIGGR
jgi:hypothetical protein